jgi:hypothetical protein
MLTRAEGLRLTGFNPVQCCTSQKCTDNLNLVVLEGSILKTRSGWMRMQGENKERWKLLCEQAAVEKDPVKLHALIKEINDLLEAKEARLKGSAPSDRSG